MSLGSRLRILERRAGKGDAMWYVVAVPEFDAGGERYSEEQKSALVDQAIAAEGIDLNDDRVVIIRTFARDDFPRGRIVNRFGVPKQ